MEALPEFPHRAAENIARSKTRRHAEINPVLMDLQLTQIILVTNLFMILTVNKFLKKIKEL